MSADDEKSLQKEIDEETGASIAYWKRRDAQRRWYQTLHDDEIHHARKEDV